MIEKLKRHSITSAFRLESKKNKNGTRTVGLRLIKNRDNKFRKVIINSLPLRVFENKWDVNKQCLKPLTQEAVTINTELYKLKSKLDAYLATHEGSTLDEVFDFLFTGEEFVEKINFLEILENFKDVPYYGKIKSEFTKESYASTVRVITKYIGSDFLDMADINVNWLNSFCVFLSKVRKIRQTTIYKHIKNIKSAYNNHTPIHDIKNPFRSFKIDKGQHEKKDHLTQEELKILFKAKLDKGGELAETLNAFRFSLHCRGLRISDILQLRFEQIINGKIYCNTQKTQLNFYAEVDDVMNEIIVEQGWPARGVGFIFNFLPDNFKHLTKQKQHLAIKIATAKINRKLKIIAKKAGITKSISFHVARNTVGQTLYEAGRSIAEIGEVLGQKKPSTTEIYLKSLGNESANTAIKGIWTY